MGQDVGQDRYQEDRHGGPEGHAPGVGVAVVASAGEEGRYRDQQVHAGHRDACHAVEGVQVDEAEDRARDADGEGGHPRGAEAAQLGEEGVDRLGPGLVAGGGEEDPGVLDDHDDAGVDDREGHAEADEGADRGVGPRRHHGADVAAGQGREVRCSHRDRHDRDQDDHRRDREGGEDRAGHVAARVLQFLGEVDRRREALRDEQGDGQARDHQHRRHRVRVAVRARHLHRGEAADAPLAVGEAEERHDSGRYDLKDQEDARDPRVGAQVQQARQRGQEHHSGAGHGRVQVGDRGQVVRRAHRYHRRDDHHDQEREDEDQPAREPACQCRHHRVLAARAGDEGAQLRVAERHGDAEDRADRDREGGRGAERAEQVGDDHEERGRRCHAGQREKGAADDADGTLQLLRVLALALGAVRRRLGNGGPGSGEGVGHALMEH